MDKHLFHYKGIQFHMFIVGIVTVCQGMAIVFQATFLAKAITAMFNGTAWVAVLPYLFGFIVAFLVRHFLQWIKERIAFRFAESRSLEYQTLLIEKLFELGPRGIGKQGSGNMITLALEGIPKFRTYLELFIPRSISMVCVPVIVLIYIFTIDILSGIVLVVTMPILIIFLILLGLVAKKHTNAQWATYQMLSRHFVDSLRGLVTLKYLGKSKSHQHAIKEVSEKYRIATNKSLRLAFLSTFALDFFSSLSIAVVAVELGLRLIDGGLGLELALIILILAPDYFQPIRDLGNDYHATMDGKDAGQQILRIVTSKSPIESVEPVHVPQWQKDSVLSVKQLSKRSEEQIPIIEDISFSVKGYQKVGIIGSSGAGKSTFIDLLSGFQTISSGSLSINETQLTDLSVSNWQQQLFYIPQHPYIFSGTVAENIKLYFPNATKEQVERAIKMTGLTELIQRFPTGLEEPIGQGGRQLSGGEEQRIALARCLLQERPIMLFDEPTAHLDIETEYEIKEMILPFLNDRLVFFSTHRLHWMLEMDIIFVLEKGRLVEVGTHQELLAKQGVYFNLVETQREEVGD